MKNTFGNSISLTLFGESHGPQIGVVLDGLAPGMTVSEDRIRAMLALRRPAGQISTARVEADEFQIVSGVFEGKTTGTPLTILIPNTNTKSKDYSETRFLARPGHADYTAYQKYHGFEDYRGGGHFSGRLTAALVAAGGILMPALERKGICIGTHIQTLGGGALIKDAAFAEDETTLCGQIEGLKNKPFPVLDPAVEDAMKARIMEAASDGDSVGGILETAVCGMPAGVGEPWFDTIEGALAHALFSIPAVKGVEFGEAFRMIEARGSAYNDAFIGTDAKIRTQTNHNGGMNGGITNGMPLQFRTVIKPTPSIFKEQQTVDIRTGENRTLSLKGRHDPAIIHRARIVVDSMTAFVLADFLSMRYGTDHLAD